MRRLLLLLMIVIAPLRSMAGDLMALEMATQQFAAVADGRGAAVSEAGDRQYAGGSLPGPHSDCMEQSIVRASDAGPADQQPDGSTASHCQTCSRCQVCSSAAFALCELSARAGWPAGVVNLVHGDADAIAGLCAAGADCLVYAGEAELGAQVAAIAARCGTRFVGPAA